MSNIPYPQLVPFGPQYFPTLISWITSEEELVQFAGPTFRYPLTPAQLTTNLADPKRQAFALVGRAHPDLLGHGEIYHRGAWVDFSRLIINPQKRGMGLGKRLVQALIQVVKASYDTQEIRLKVYDWNSAAIHVYQHLGFKIDPAVRFESPVGEKIWVAYEMVYTTFP